MIKLKQDINTQIELSINESNYQRRAQNGEESSRAVERANQAFEEMTIFKNDLKSLQDERKRDVEETAEFIN